MNIGGSNRTIYDNCAYAKDLYESTAPLAFQLYQGAYENCNKCIIDHFYRPYDLVNIESELKNITRFVSKCDQNKYNPDCKMSNRCISTFDRNIPRIPVPEVCPIIFNNIPKQTSPGYKLPTSNICN